MVAVVIPAYNEEKTIREVVEAVKSYVDEIIVVDDGSSDKTAKVALLQGAKVLRHFLNRGQGAALQTGIEAALGDGADIIVTFDADGQFNAAEISEIVEPIKNHAAEVVLGSRFLSKTSNISNFKKLLLKLAVIFTRLATGLNITDTHNGFRVFSREAALKIKIRQDRMAHSSEILEQIASQKISYKEIPVTVRYTEYSLKKGQKLFDYFKILKDLFLGKML